MSLLKDAYRRQLEEAHKRRKVQRRRDEYKRVRADETEKNKDACGKLLLGMRCKPKEAYLGAQIEETAAPGLYPRIANHSRRFFSPSVDR